MFYLFIFYFKMFLFYFIKVVFYVCYLLNVICILLHLFIYFCMFFIAIVCRMIMPIKYFENENWAGEKEEEGMWELANRCHYLFLHR